MDCIAKRRTFVLGVMVAGLATGLGPWALASPGRSDLTVPGEFVVHEWGTFLSVQGSDGVTLGGMVDSDEVLPPFVEERGLASWQRTQLFSKMETPVTYFYTDRPRDVQVRVDMPRGLLTHWFPRVNGYGPKPAPAAANAGSFLDWGRLHLIPPQHPEANAVLAPTTFTLKNGQTLSGLIEAEDATQIRLRTGPYALVPIAKEQVADRRILGPHVPTLKPVDPEQIWRFARQTDAALVRKLTPDAKKTLEFQAEKFLFYRGVGTFGPPLHVETRPDPSAGLSLRMTNQSDLSLRNLFAIDVQGATLRFAALHDLPGRGTQEVSTETLLSAPLPLEEGVRQTKEAVAAALIDAGLYAKEAAAMVNTWERSYFRTEGFRLLYLLPRRTVDELIPIRIEPAPQHLVRVMVGRLELLTPDQERQIEQWVAELGAQEASVRTSANKGLARLGRLCEPALHRIVAVTKDPEVLARARSLLDQAAPRK